VRFYRGGVRPRVKHVTPTAVGLTGYFVLAMLNDIDQGKVRDVVINRKSTAYTDGRRFHTYAPNDLTLVQAWGQSGPRGVR
jgi:hypothetical protein